MLCIMLPCLQRKTGHQMFSRGEEIKVVDANSRGFIGLILHISLTEGNTKKKKEKNSQNADIKIKFDEIGT